MFSKGVFLVSWNIIWFTHNTVQPYKHLYNTLWSNRTTPTVMKINTNYVIYTFSLEWNGIDFQNLSPPRIFVQIAWNSTDLLSSTISKSSRSVFWFILNLSKNTGFRKKVKPKLRLFSTSMHVKFQFFRYKNLIH